ncbi:MAG: AAA family ATPase, partial [bacterium]
MTIPTERIIRELSRPGAYPHPVEGVKVIQTHISVVFLAGDRAYKVKKPVDFGFLDFTTLEKRLHFCREELRLNRRLSEGVYLGIASVLEGAEGLNFSMKIMDDPSVSETIPDPGVEYAVVMKRLDESRILSALLEEGSVQPADMEAIAQRIAKFHLKAESSRDITSKGGKKAVIFNTEEDFEQIKPFVGDTLSKETFERIAQYTRTFIKVNSELFAAREAEGWIRDGHGDLHTQHICLTDGIQIFDCIEFNERFRYGDVLVDAAFLTMDLERLGFKELADRFTATYLEAMEQTDQAALYNFYACYRAVVRGKVEGFRSKDPDVGPAKTAVARENARTFFELGEKYARTPVPPVLMAGCGLMGSGKSTLARALKERLDFIILSSDVVRKELAGMDPTATRHVPFGEDIYSRDFGARTYKRLHERATEHLKRGQS